LAQQEDAKSFALAVAHVSAGRPAAAIPLLKPLLTHDPQNGAAKLYMAACYAMTDNFELSLEALGEKAWPDSLDVFALLLRGRCLLAMQRAPEALALLKGVDAQVNHPAVRTLLGDVYRMSGRILEAERTYRDVIAEEPRSTAAHTALSEILLVGGHFEQAAEAALNATALDFGESRAHFALALALRGLRRGDAARQALRNCLQVQPEHAEARKLLARMG
jgi:tetratricopeptide (TPR) repeat protein